MATGAADVVEVSKDIFDEPVEFRIGYYRRIRVAQGLYKYLFPWEDERQLPVWHNGEKSHRVNDIKVLEVLNLFGNELVDNRLTINLALRECGQNCRIYLRRPFFIHRDRYRSRSLLHDNRFGLCKSREVSPGMIAPIKPTLRRRGHANE